MAGPHTFTTRGNAEQAEPAVKLAEKSRSPCPQSCRSPKHLTAFA